MNLNFGKIKLCFLSSMLVALSACASTAQVAETPQAPSAPPASAPPPSVVNALMTPAVVAKTVPEDRFNVDVEEIPARAFFMSLVQETKTNMVVHPDVSGTISLTLKDVTISEVMALLREVYGYEYERRGQGYIVLPARLQSQIFQVDYLNLQRIGESRTRVNNGELTASRNTNGAGGQGSGTGSSGGGGANTEQNYGTQVETKTSSDYWAELEVALRTIVGSGEGRSIVLSPQASMVVVRALPSELRDVQQFLKDSGAAISRQVILEAKIVEVTLSNQFQSGINWGSIANVGSSTGTIGQTGGGSIFGDTGVSGIAGATGNLDPNNLSAVNNTQTTAFGGVFSMMWQGADFSAFIELLKTQGDVRVLSSPRVSTTNNQKAVIKVGSDEYFVTGVSTTTTTGTATTTSPSVELSPFFSGISLDVTPQIGSDGQVLLHVQPTVSQVRDQNKRIDLGGDASVLNLPLAFSTVRQADTIVRARDRQLIVIGGLMQEREEDREARTPGLGDIPVLGNLFKQKRKVAQKTELVILLRPTIVDSQSVWDEAARAKLAPTREFLER